VWRERNGQRWSREVLILLLKSELAPPDVDQS
jgi:hypothetical protein